MLSSQPHVFHQVTRLLRWLLTQNHASASAEVRHCAPSTIRDSRILRALSESSIISSAWPQEFYTIGREFLRSCIKLPHQAAAVSMQDRQRLPYDVCAREIYWLQIWCIVISSLIFSLLTHLDPSTADIPCVLCNRILSMHNIGAEDKEEFFFLNPHIYSAYI